MTKLLVLRKSELMRLIGLGQTPDEYIAHGNIVIANKDLRGLTLPVKTTGFFSLENCDIRGVKLPREARKCLTISNCQAAGAIIPGDLKNYKFSGTNFTGVDFSRMNCNLFQAENCDLTDAILPKNLRKTISLTSCVIKNTIFPETFDSLSITASNLDDLHLPDPCDFQLSLSRCDLRQFKLPRTYKRGLFISWCDLDGVSLDGLTLANDIRLHCVENVNPDHWWTIRAGTPYEKRVHCLASGGRGWRSLTEDEQGRISPPSAGATIEWPDRETGIQMWRTEYGNDPVSLRKIHPKIFE